MHHLGPTSFDFAGKRFIRTDLELRNSRGLAIQCSHWEPAPEYRPNAVLPCVVYMHGNSSARLEAIPQLSLVLAIGSTMFTFDFCGSGKSDGEYVSLGAFEKDDLMCAIEHLRSTGTTSTIALWGRSMGAATALLHGERDPSIAGMILDSSFCDLQTLAEEMVERGRQHGLFAPGFVVSIAIRWIRGDVQKRAEFDIYDLSPIKHADKCFIPALFVAAEGDDFVPPHHSQRIHDEYAGEKNMIRVRGDHNSARPKYFLDSASIFLFQVLQIPEHWMLEDGHKLSGTAPWGGTSRVTGRKPAQKKDLRTQQRKQQQRHDDEEDDGGLDVTLDRYGNGEGLTLDELLALSLQEEMMEASIEEDERAKRLVDVGEGEEYEVGMTRTKQEEVRQTLFRALGGSSSSTTSSTVASSSSKNSTVHKSSDSESIFSPRVVDVAVDQHLQVPAVQVLAQQKWSCTVCTLLNEPNCTECLACGTLR